MTGRCLCGSVEFAVDGSGTPIELCHCGRCRKAYGTAFAATFYVRARRFTWTRGEELVRVHAAPLLAAPPPYRHAFCARCGSPLPIVVQELGVVEIPAGVVDGDPGSRPLRHIFTSRKATWFDVSDELPQYEAHVDVAEHLIARLLRSSETDES